MEVYIKNQTAQRQHMAMVYNATQQPIYYVVGRQGMLNDSFELHELSGNLVGEIKQVSPGFLPRFDILIANKKVGAIKRIIGVWHQFIFVTDLRWIITGDLLDNHYQAFTHGQLVFQVDTALLSDGALAKDLIVKRQQDVPVAILISMILDLWSKNTKRGQAPSPITDGQLIWGD
ncbi:LURP-one-related/scramblase family protein [Agrilactobacillus fermenti]|uniref:LURP-one-related/scramblase family protein n=1 Tax=Agrilactobacillus fermenti TaxID=2586909 RepID=UPI001E33DD0F|nr:hypothetical protein [Agrilactobacillus fermenti]MCD2256881.1 hypothetical protein [Agrilactobacillus fermenti]